MKVYLFFLIKAATALVATVLLIFLPETSAGWFGIEVAQSGIMLLRLLGAFLFGVAFLCWFSAFNDSALSARNIMFSIAMLDSLATIVLLAAQIEGVMNAAGLIVVVLFALFAVSAWFYFIIGGRNL